MEPSPFTDSEFKSRQNQLVESLKDIDYSLIFSRPDLYYYSSLGMDGVLEVSNGVILHYVRRNLELAKAESKLPVSLMESYRLFKEVGKRKEIKTLGMELDLVPFKTVKYIRKALGNPEIIDISNRLRSIRAVKSPAEVRQIELSCEQTDRSFEVASEVIKPGVREIDISAEIERQLRRDGHPGWVQVRMFHHNLSNLAFVMAGESIASLNSKFGPFSGMGITRMHLNGSSARKVKSGDPVVIDTTGIVAGYVSDVTRTFFVGDVDQRLIDTHEVAIKVQEKTGELLVKEAQTNEVYSQLIEYVDELGYLDHFMGIHGDKVQFIGHGIGLELDEYPIITPGYKAPLALRNIIAIEPKLLLEDPKTGVGVEETWVVGEFSGRRLSKYPLRNYIRS